MKILIMFVFVMMFAACGKKTARGTLQPENQTQESQSKDLTKVRVGGKDYFLDKKAKAWVIPEFEDVRVFQDKGAPKIVSVPAKLSIKIQPSSLKVVMHGASKALSFRGLIPALDGTSLIPRLHQKEVGSVFPILSRKDLVSESECGSSISQQDELLNDSLPIQANISDYSTAEKGFVVQFLVPVSDGFLNQYLMKERVVGKKEQITSCQKYCSSAKADFTKEFYATEHHRTVVRVSGNFSCDLRGCCGDCGLMGSPSGFKISEQREGSDFTCTSHSLHRTKTPFEVTEKIENWKMELDSIARSIAWVPMEYQNQYIESVPSEVNPDRGTADFNVASIGL